MKVIITVNLLFKIRPILSGPTHTPALGSLTAFTTWTWWPLLARHKYPSPLCRFLCHLALFQWSLETRLLIKIAVLFQVGFNLLLDFSKQGQVSAAQFLIIWQSTNFFSFNKSLPFFSNYKTLAERISSKALSRKWTEVPSCSSEERLRAHTTGHGCLVTVTVKQKPLQHQGPRGWKEQLDFKV